MKGKSNIELCTEATFFDFDIFIIPCDGSTRNLYTDLTSIANNEISIEIINTSESPDCVMTLIIEHRDGTTTERVVPNPPLGDTFSSLAILDKDVVSVSVRCDGNPLEECSGSTLLSGLSCICLECVSENCKGEAHNEICNSQESNCQNRGLSFSTSFQQACDGVPRIVFENLSDRDSIMGLTISNFTETCIMTAIIETFGGESFEREVTANLGLNLVVEDLRRLSIRCVGNPGEICQGSAFGDKDFCFCCSTDLGPAGII